MNKYLSEEAACWIYQLRQACRLYDEDKEDEAFNMLEKFNENPLRSNVLTLMGEYLCEPQNKPIHDDLMDTWRYNVPDVSNPTDRNLIKRALGIYRDRFGEDVGYGVYNLISILKNTRVDLSGEDLSMLDLSRCMLNGTPLSHNGCCADLHGAKIDRSTIFSPGHKMNINDICYSPDGEYIATASEDGTVIIRNTKTYSVATVINCYSKAVNTVRYINDDYILTASNDGSAKIWNVRTHTPTATLNHFTDDRRKGADDDNASPIRSAVSPDGTYIATWSYNDNRVCIWDVDTFELIKAIVIDSNVHDLIFHPDSKAVAVILGDTYEGFLPKSNRLELWDIIENSCYFSFDLSQNNDTSELLCFTPDKTAILVRNWNIIGYQGGFLYSINTTVPAVSDTLEITSVSKAKINVNGALCSSTGNDLIVFGSYLSDKIAADDTEKGVLLILDQNTMTIKRSVAIPLGRTMIKATSTLSPSGRYIAFAPTPYLPEYDIIIVDTEACELENIIRSASAGINSLALFADGKHFVTVNTTGENMLRIWNTMTGRCVGELDGGNINITTAVITPNMSTLIVAYDNGCIKLYDPILLNCAGELEGHSSRIKTIACDGNSRYAVIADLDTVGFDNQIMIWDLAERRRTGKISQKRILDSETFDYIRDIRFLPSGVFAVLSNSLSIWNIYGERIDLLDIENDCYGYIGSISDTEVTLCGYHGYAKYALLSHTKLREELCPDNNESSNKTEYLCGTCDMAVACTNEMMPDKATLRVINTHTGSTLSEVCFPERVYKANFSPNDKRLLICSSGDGDKLTILDPASCSVLGVIDMHSGVNIFGCDMHDLHIDSRLTYDDIEDLRRYGAIVD